MIHITPMTLEHISAVAELEKCCFHDPWSERSIASELDNELSFWLVAMDDHRVVGYVGSQTVLGETDMMNIAVSPEKRRCGIAQMLVDNLVEHLKESESHCLTLEVRASNEPAISLYRRNGFLEVGRRRNYYYSPREDALIMRKEWEL